MGLLDGLIGGKIGYGAQPGGVTGGYGGMLGGGMNTGPMGNLSDILTGLGVGLLSQGPSTTPISPYAGIGQGLQYANQLGQQRRATGQQQFQNQLLSQEAARQGQTADIQKQAFEIEKQKGTREQQQYDLQQQHLNAYADTIQDPQQKAAFMADPAAYIKNVMPSPSTDVQNYKFYQSQGGTLPFNDWQVQLKRSGANQFTLNQPPAETAFQHGLGDQESKEINSITDTANQARSVNDQLAIADALRKQLQAAGSDTGKLLPIITQISSIGQSLGIDTSKLGGQTPDATAASQALDAVTKRLALGNIGSGKEGAIPANNFSEADRNFVVGMAVNAADTPGGFSVKKLVQNRVNSRSIAKEKMWLSGGYNHGPNGAPSEADYRAFAKDWGSYVDSHPLFTDTEQQNLMQLATTGSATPPAGATQAPAPIPIIPQHSLPSTFQ